MLLNRVLANMPCNACPNSCRNVVTSENVSSAGLSGVGFVKFIVTETCGRLLVPLSSIHCSL